MSVSEAAVAQHRAPFRWLRILRPPFILKVFADRRQHRMSWYDSLMVATALEGHCPRLYSQDCQSQDCQQGRKIQDVRTENRLPDGRNPRSFLILLDSNVWR